MSAGTIPPIPGDTPPPSAVPLLSPPSSPRPGFKTPRIDNLGDLLDFQRAALQEAIFHKGTSDANRTALRKVVANLPNPATIGAAWAGFPLPELYKLGAQHYDQLPPVLRGVYDSMLDTGTDPLTLETADTGTLAKFGLKMLARPIAMVGHFDPDILDQIGHAATRFLNFGGEAINKLGRPKAYQAIGMLNRAKGEEKELYRRFHEINKQIMTGLTPSQTSAVQKILHGQLPEELEAQVMRNPVIAQAVRARKELTDNVIRMQAAFGSNIEERLGRVPLLKPLQQFAGRVGEFGTENVRERYFPGKNYEREVDPNQPARDIRLLDARNPHVHEQSLFKITSKNVEDFENAFEGMLKTSARAISANRARAELGKIYGGIDKIPQEIHDIFTIHVPATGRARTLGQKAQEAIKGLVNLPKLGIVGTTPVHMFNILALLLARAPEQVPLAALHMARIVKNSYKPFGGNELKRFEAMLPAIERGIDIATHEKGGTILSHLPLNKLTWDWDAAAKLALSDKYIKAGMNPLEAGVKASHELVNYANKSPLTGLLQWFMPFATFAEGGLKSVASSVAHAPALVELENRLTGGTFLGGGKPYKDVTTYQPPANVGRAMPLPKDSHKLIPDNPWTEAATLPARMALPYIRSKTSDLIKVPAAGLAALIPGGAGISKWILSGRTFPGAAADILTSPIPYARDLLNMLPIHGGKTIRGYKPDPLSHQLLFSSTGVSLPNKPAPAVSPSPTAGPGPGSYIPPIPP